MKHRGLLGLLITLLLFTGGGGTSEPNNYTGNIDTQVSLQEFEE